MEPLAPYMFQDNSIGKETVRKKILKNMKKKILQEKQKISHIRYELLISSFPHQILMLILV